MPKKGCVFLYPWKLRWPPTFVLMLANNLRNFMAYKRRINLENKLFKDVPLKVRGRAREIARKRGLPIKDALSLAQREYERRKQLDFELEERKKAFQMEMERKNNPDEPRGITYFRGVVQGGA